MDLKYNICIYIQVEQIQKLHLTRTWVYFQLRGHKVKGVIKEKLAHKVSKVKKVNVV